MELLIAVRGVFQNPPIPYESAKHSLKAWAKYCLQSRGYKVVYAETADFAVETRAREKVYFKVSDRPQEPDPKATWIIWDSTTQTASLVPPRV